MSKDITCGKCKYIRKEYGKIYCYKYGLCISGTLERLEECKREKSYENQK